MPSLIVDLALILVTAGIVTVVFKALKQPLVLGYIMAGFIVSPNMSLTMSISDNTNVATWADIGVMFLLFALGLGFSFKKILKMGFAPIIAALIIIIAMMTLGMVVSDAFGWSSTTGLFVAGMLAMSSTTIIYKAFDDLGLQQQQFSSLVMSVLILEDILAIILMVVLSTVVQGASGSEAELLSKIMDIGFFLILWFVIGMFFIPIFLRKVRPLINDEVLLILSLALCCAMAVIANQVGFSPAFGSFVMGSILAETIEGQKIEKLVEPVKNLFGAIFFVSIGMLVNINVVVEHWSAIVVLTLTIIIGQVVFGTVGFFVAGQPLKTAMQCGFSMAQIGEFAFIIGGLGLSLNVIPSFMYPVIVTVSVITTFLTPYMIRGSVPAYRLLEKSIPRRWLRKADKLSGISPANIDNSQGYWRPLLTQMIGNTLIYTVLCIAVMLVMLTEGEMLLDTVIPDMTTSHVMTFIITVLLMSPFLRAMVMKKNKSDEYKALWMGNYLNRAPLMFTILARAILAIWFVWYACDHLITMPVAIDLAVSVMVILLIVYSKAVKRGSIKMERMFLLNLKSKDIAARERGLRRPLFEGRLLAHDIHISTVNVPQDSFWGGRNLRDLNLGQRFGVHISSILRGNYRINIPSGEDFIFPMDQLNVIGTDEQLKNLSEALKKEVFPERLDYLAQEMQLRRLIVTKDSKLAGQSLESSDLRNMYSCMLIGKEAGGENLSKIAADYQFQPGDIFWAVGEKQDLDLLAKDI